MALDLNEDKDLSEKISVFFSKNKKNIILYSIIFIVCYFALIFFISQDEKKYFLASNLYQKLQLANEKNDVEVLANELTEKYANTVYASRASIYLGNVYFKNKNFSKAKDSYLWAASNSPEASIRSLANYHIGNLFFVRKDFEAGIEFANLINENGFIGLKNNLLGDLYNSAGKSDDANKHYEIAYEFYKNKNDIAKVIKIKIDSINQK